MSDRSSTGSSYRVKARFVLGLTLALTLNSITACATTPSATSQPSNAAGTTRPSGPLPIRVGMADPGSWTTTAFKPTLTFIVGSDGWIFFFVDDEDEMAIGKSGGIELTGSRVARVVDPSTHKGVDAPDDIVAWLGTNPDLEAGTPDAARVAGIDGKSIDVSNTGKRDVDIFAFPSGNVRVSVDTRARIWVLPYDGPDLVFSAFAPAASFEQTLPEIQKVLDWMQIRAS